MNRHIQNCLRTFAFLLAPAAAAGQAASPADAVDFDAVVGGRLMDSSGSREKFQEYGAVTDGFFIDRLRLTMGRAATPEHLEIDVRNAARDDEAYRLSYGRRGMYELTVDYQGIPHRFAGGQFLWSGFGTGRLQIADVVQSQLQANEQTSTERGVPATDPNTDTTGEDATQQSIVRGLYAAANGVRYQLERRRFGAGFRYQLGEMADAWVRVSNENRTGARQIGAGTYERWNVGSGLTHTIDRFLTTGWELAEPLRQRTLSASAGVGVHREGWLADVEYTFTQFRNFDDVLLWDNPFRITDDIQTTTPAGFDRGRHAVGQIVLPVNSLAHDVTASAGVELPLDGRFTATLGYGMVTQDDPFQPYTRNTALLATNVAGTPSAATLDRPASDLGGDVRTLSGTASVTLRPVHPVTVGARYGVYRYDGKSDEITFPGYAAFGESGWRTVKNDKNAPVMNEVFDYTRQGAELSADFRLTPMVTVTAKGDWEGWNFDHLRLDKMNEYGVGGGVTVRPVRAAMLRASYRYADRSVDGYLKGRTAENPEATGLLNFNWADRKRHQADVRLQYAPGTLVTVAGFGRFVDEDYGGETEGGTVVDQFRFGRTGLRGILGGADATVTMDRIGFRASYEREYRKESLASAAKDDTAKATAFFGFADDYSPVNYWDSRIREDVDTVGVGVNARLMPRVTLDASYDLSFSSMRVRTSNPNPIDATTLANAVANDWPTIRDRRHDVAVDLACDVTSNVRAGARYLFAWNRLDDFAWDNLDPYMAGRTPENTTRFLFADATYTGYSVHVGSVYLAGRF